ASHPHQPLHGASWTARRQEVARAVRDPYPQAPARHPRAQPGDPRCAHEARSERGRRGRDQVLRITPLPQGTESRSSTMAKVTVYNLRRESVGEIELADDVYK